MEDDRQLLCYIISLDQKWVYFHMSTLKLFSNATLCPIFQSKIEYVCLMHSVCMCIKEYTGFAHLQLNGS